MHRSEELLQNVFDAILTNFIARSKQERGQCWMFGWEALARPPLPPPPSTPPSPSPWSGNPLVLPRHIFWETTILQVSFKRIFMSQSWFQVKGSWWENFTIAYYFHTEWAKKHFRFRFRFRFRPWIDHLIDWLFNGKSTQKGQFVPTAGDGIRLSRLRMANKIQCIIPHVTR